jgi:hypothetical protein
VATSTDRFEKRITAEAPVARVRRALADAGAKRSR